MNSLARTHSKSLLIDMFLLVLGRITFCGNRLQNSRIVVDVKVFPQAIDDIWDLSISFGHCPEDSQGKPNGWRRLVNLLDRPNYL